MQSSESHVSGRSASPEGENFKTLINGVARKHVEASDRGLLYGDGLFRTALVHVGEILDLDRHLSHLQTGARRLLIPLSPAFLGSLTAECELLAARSGDAALKMIVTRGRGGRGYTPPADVRPTRIVTCSPLPERPDSLWRNGAHITVCKTRVTETPSLAGIKHLNRLPQVLARAEWQDRRIFEGLMLDSNGQVIGGTMSNVFAVRQNSLYTPALTAAGVAGTLREQVLEAAAGDTSCHAHTGLWGPGFYSDSDEMFITNALIGIVPVRSLDGHVFAETPGAVTRRLMREIRHPMHERARP